MIHVRTHSARTKNAVCAYRIHSMFDNRRYSVSGTYTMLPSFMR